MKTKVTYFLVVLMAGLSFALGSLFGTRGGSAQVQQQRSEEQLHGLGTL